MEKLENTHHEVIGIDIEDWDIRDPAPQLGPEFDDVACVVHLAALVKVGESVKFPWEYYDTNVNGTLHTIFSFPKAKFIFASTGAAFNPESPYGMSKVMAEDIIKQLHGEYTIFRFYNVGGRTPSNPEGLYQATMNARKRGEFTIFGDDYDTKDGTPVRDYIHVEDICDAIIKAIEEPAACTNYEPLGSGKSYTVKEYIDAFNEVNGQQFEVKYGPRRAGDLEKSEVPFVSKFMTPKYDLKDIVKL